MNRALLRKFRASLEETEKLRELSAQELLSEIKAFCDRERVIFRVCVADFKKSGFFRKSPHYLIDDERIITPETRRLLRAVLDYGVLRSVPVWHDTTSELQWRGYTPEGIHRCKSYENTP